ncbi:MAG: DUF2075 domain-containing protein [Candidatus Diapherotrites archaeon]|nr:DUF2075 domain-containing protein [Candidatus Diapherotrites archaeon]
MKRVKSGMRLLDAKLSGGFPENAVILVSGDAGTGKTLFALNYLMQGLQDGEKCVYLTLNEDAEGILRASDGIKSLQGIRKHLGKNLVVDFIRIEDMVDLNYFANIFESYPKVDRLVIDNLNKILIFAETHQDYRMNLAKLVHHLRNRSKSTLLICETLDNTLDTGNGESYECDGAVSLSLVEVDNQPMRLLGIYKMRYTPILTGASYPLFITDEGLHVGPKRVI